MKKVLVVIGPTAVGKTSLSLDLAKQFHGEIISGDSIQVYRGFDIGSAKITQEEMQGIKHHCIDILDKKEAYSVYDFQLNARKAIEEITSRNLLPILAGGTGLYIKAALYDYHFDSQNDTDLKLSEEKYQKYTNEELYEILKQTDEKTAQTIHPNNRKRVIRALCIAENAPQKKSENLAAQNHQPIYDVLMIGLTMDRNLLHERINRRVEIMMEHGLKEEIEKLLSEGETFDDRAMQGIGYREWREYFEGNHTIDEVKEEIQKNSRQFAKRQMTWFKNQFDVKWFDCTYQDVTDDVKETVMRWLNRNEE